MVMRVQLRIVAGALRGRKLLCTVGPGLRPTPQMVREALFSILGNAIPGRPFLDVFAGTGVNGLEALSRGASSALFVERDFRLAQEIDRHLRAFDLTDRGPVVRSDAYRWAQHWEAPAEPANIFLSPPFADLGQRTEQFLALVAALQARAAPGSVLVIQSERRSPLEGKPALADWEERRYGRNVLLIWVKEEEELNHRGTEAPREEHRDEEE
jgi:16S rRNA (guanine(966)-N(2))-methyltransferase RsmD